MNYSDLICPENLFQAWNEFKKGKTKRSDVQLFDMHLEDNLFNLHLSLQNKTYAHGPYASFYVTDPKLRHIHKASVADRIVHHMLYKYLYALFDKNFIFDSYSCRVEKGTHRGVRRLSAIARKVSRNYTGQCWALKCDIKKFFASIDHQILFDLLVRKISDENIMWLISQVIDSFPMGLPLGNVTSQVMANIFLNELDKFIKHNLKIKYYLRYADDFIILDNRKDKLELLIEPVSAFLNQNLKLELHPKKVFFRKLEWGIDFLGYIILPHYLLPRTKTKRRIFRKLEQKSLQSYLGYLSHANSYKLQQELKNKVYLLK
ncbi:MAG: reverse transcriptase/maturase family protein [Patescibacteria group bacterium]